MLMLGCAFCHLTSQNRVTHALPPLTPAHSPLWRLRLVLHHCLQPAQALLLSPCALAICRVPAHKSTTYRRTCAIPNVGSNSRCTKTPHTLCLRDGDARTCGPDRPSRGPARHDDHVALCVSEEGVVATSQEHTGRVSDPADASIGTSVLCRL
jgi:hypothetical protein